MLKSPRTWAHIGLGVVILGLLLYIILPTAYWFSLGIWTLAAVVGIISLVKNGRIFPNQRQVMGHDSVGLNILGYIEVYVSLVPTISAAAMIIYLLIAKSRG